MPDVPYRVSKPAAAGARHAAEHAVESARQAARSVSKIKEGPLTDAAKSTNPVPDIVLGAKQYKDTNPYGTKSHLDTDPPDLHQHVTMDTSSPVKADLLPKPEREQ